MVFKRLLLSWFNLPKGADGKIQETMCIISQNPEINRLKVLENILYPKFLEHLIKIYGLDNLISWPELRLAGGRMLSLRKGYELRFFMKNFCNYYRLKMNKRGVRIENVSTVCK